MNGQSIDASFFRGNRDALMAVLPPDALVVITGYDEMQLSHDAAAEFVQEASFWYLSGIERAGWGAIIDGKTGETVLTGPALEPSQVTFDGELTAEAALARSGADRVMFGEATTRYLSDLVVGRTVYTLYPDAYLKQHAPFQLNPAPARLMRTLRKHGARLKNCRPEVVSLRTRKQPAEVAAITDAVKVTADAFTAVRQELESGSSRAEYEIEARLSYDFRRHGSRGHAYAPIVAGGIHACTLHYIENASKLQDGSMVLIDAGARGVDGYAADVTRTYAVGDVSPRYRQIHAAVLDAHQQIISLIAPGVLVAEYHERVDEIMLQALTSLGMDEKRYRDYFPHAISHGLGVDVHDSMAGSTVFEPGMVLTVEPGIYLTEESAGVRIEDDILVTETGHRNLSGSLDRAL